MLGILECAVESNSGTSRVTSREGQDFDLRFLRKSIKPGSFFLTAWITSKNFVKVRSLVIIRREKTILGKPKSLVSGLVNTLFPLLFIFKQKIEPTPTLKVIKGVSLFEFMGNMQWRVFM